VRKIERDLTAAEIAALPRGSVRAISSELPGLVIANPRNPRGAPFWAYRWRDASGRLHLKSLGPIAVISRNGAAALARKEIARRVLDADYDPLAERRARRQKVRETAPAERTFETAAQEYITIHKLEWSAAHRKQWEQSIRDHVTSTIGPMLVAEVGTDAVLKVLRPKWLEIPETMSRVRNRIELILDREKVEGHRAGENPARWSGHLEHALPAVSASKKAKRKATGEDEHFAALPYVEIPAFMVELQNTAGTVPRALEFAILTASRTAEVLGARWDEIDFAKRVWAVPAERMKNDLEHLVPLSDQAFAVLEVQAKVRRSEYVFPGGRSDDRPLERSAFVGLLRRMGRSDITAHGFRSSFSTWATEQTAFVEAVRERCLAHVVGSKTSRAYDRAALLEQRTALLRAWGVYATRLPPTESGKVVQLAAVR
jgi:integrase